MFSNRYVQRRVAAADARACFVCYKPTCSVLVQESQADFFYACDAHLSDAGFAVLDAASQAAEQQRRERQAEIDELRQAWAERAKQSKNTSKSTDNTNDAATDANNANDKDTKGGTNALNNAGGGAEHASAAASPPELPAVRKTYELNKGILNLRLNAKRRAAQERRTKTLLETPGAFPKAPSHRPQ